MEQNNIVLVSNLFVGDTKVEKVYVGDELVYSEDWGEYNEDYQ